MTTLEEHIADRKAHSILTNRNTAVTEPDLNFGTIMMRGIKVGTVDVPENLPAGSIYLKVSSLTGVTLITFTIDSIQYQAEEGMTWGDWVNSQYAPEANGQHFGFSGNYVLYYGTGTLVATSDYTSVIKDNIIIGNEAYNTQGQWPDGY